MENLCDLFFEVSNEDRIRILRQLRGEASTVSRLSKDLGLTTQETSRHISRLFDVSLVEKDPDGLHRLTFYGELALEQLRGLLFTSRHREYFNSHSLAHLPGEFVGRLGELSGLSYTDDVMLTFHSVEKVIQGAEEYVWAMTDQYLISAIPLLAEAVERGVEFRLLQPLNPPLPPGFYEREDARYLRQVRGTDSFRQKILERVETFITLSDKEEAVVAFPALDGRLDYRGFEAKDELSYKWCRDLFQHYWESTNAEVRSTEPVYERNE